MQIDGYVFCHGKLPWNHVFSQNIRLKCINDALYESFITCDINDGYVHKLKSYTTKHNGSMFNHLSTEYWIKYKFIKCRMDLLIHRDNGIKFRIDNEKIIDNAAQFVILNDRYVYFLLTTYAFWNDIKYQLKDVFNVENLGGYLVDIYKHYFVKNYLEKQGFKQQ